MILLDTCALLWLAAGEHAQLTPKTLQLIDESELVCVSAISGFEIAIKAVAGKLVLPSNPQEWLREIIAFHDIMTLDLSLEICGMSACLPAIHKDPCDRFIIATAMVHHMPVVTKDARFEGYGIEVLR